MMLRTALGAYGDNLVADDNGMVPTEGDTETEMSFTTPPDSPDSTIRFGSWDEYYKACLTAETRAANAGH